MSEFQDDKTSAADEDQRIIQEAKKFFDMVAEAEAQYRKDAVEDLKFFTGEQWPDDIKTQRSSEGRPCLTINRVAQLVRQITNDQRQNRPSLKAYPFDSKADIETAEVIQGLFKNIEYNSNADFAYDTACHYQVIAGKGFFRIGTDYSDPMSFDQDLKVMLIENPSSVYFDPFSIEPDGSDANKCLIADDISQESFKEKYPDAQLSQMSDWKSVGDGNVGWVTVDGCRIAEYMVRQYKREQILHLSSGDTFLAKQYEEGMDFGQDEKGKPITVIGKRTALIPTVKLYKINGVEILEKTEWPGMWIPVIPVYGDRTNVDGKIHIEGIIRNAKDAQRAYNFWTSAETEAIALAPKSPWVMADGQDEGYEQQWRDANRKNFSVLKYNPVSLGGELIGPPKRNVEEPAVQAITQAKTLAADDMKATTGVYDAGVGAQGPESSGIAIQKRNTQIQTTNFHYSDNFNRSLKHAGRIMMDAIPKVYDTARAVRILKDDGTTSMVAINQIFMKSGQPKRHDMDIGKYDVAVESGPSFATKRMEAAQSLEKVIRAYPQLMTVAGDLLVQNMDWPGAHQLAERLRKTIPPNLLDNDGEMPIPPQVQAQLSQAHMLLDQFSKQTAEMSDIIEKKKLELASKEKIEFAKLQMAAEIALLKEGSKSAEFSLEKQIELLDREQAILAANQPLSTLSQNPGAGGKSAAMPGQQNMPTGGPPPG